MAVSFTGRKRIRKSFGRIPEIAEMPNLIEVQKISYDQFLQVGSTPQARTETGLQEVFKSVFPIRDFSERAELQFVRYELEDPKYDVEECQQRGMTFAAPLKVTLRLVVWDVDEDTGARSIRDIKEQDVYMGDMPLMTSNGTFIVNGTERVIVSQMHRSPGVFFDHDRGKTHSSGKYLFAARVIPYRGSWLDFEFDAKDIVYVRIDRRRKLPATTLLYALDSAATEKLRAERKAEDKTLEPFEAVGMSAEEVLSLFYDNVVYSRTKDAWKTPFDPERLRGQKLTHDLVDAKTGESVLEAGEKLTPRKARKMIEEGLKEVRVADEELAGHYLAEDLIDESNGLVLAEAGDELTVDLLAKLVEAGVKKLPVLAIDHVNVGAYLRNTLAVDKNRTREDALIDIYRVMRPGEPPTLETAEAMFNSLFFDSERYDLSAVGRVKMNARLGFETDDQLRVLRKQDILSILKVLHELKDGRGDIDDIDHLGNRRVRSVGELLENQYRVGLLRMERAIKETVEAIEPRFSRGELIASLAQVQQSMDAAGADDAVIVLLSDFPSTSAYFEQPLPPELEGLGDRATIVTAQPPEGTDNVQVLSLGLRRQMVVAEATGSTVVGGQVVLRRFGAIGQPRTVQLKVSVQTPADQVLTEMTRDVRFGAGSREQSANFDLPVQLPGEALIGSGRELIVRAGLVADASDAGLDVLPADDSAVAIVRLRDRLQVAMIDNEQGINPNAGELEPWQWVRAALTPQGPGAAGSFELSTMLPAAVNSEAIESYDAAIVLRPDELTLRGWETLQQFAQRGGLVWVFTPALETEADWAQTMQRTFDLPSAIGDALVRYEPAERSTKRSAEVDETIAPPEALQFLAADWREKLGWWSLQSWLPLSTEDEDRWVALKTDDAAVPENDKAVVLAQRAVGDGSLVFSAVPLDTRFTNLPIRALFVPLMHDTLRGVLGNQAGQLPLVAGDEPALNRAWRGVGELGLLGDDKAVKLLVQSDGDEVALRGAAEQPGVYLGTVGGSPRLLAVNPDADAGDTVGGRGPLELLLDELGGWSYLSERQQAGGVLAKTALGRDLTMLLLWVLLALVLLETFLARWFSHATDHSTPTVIGRALGALRGSESDQPIPGAAGGDA